MSIAAQKKTRMATEKPKYENARKLKGIFFIDPEDGENKETIKNARKELEVPVEAAMPCKMGIRKRLKELQATGARGITESNGKTKYAFIVEAHESTRKPLEPTLPRNHEDHTAERGFDSMNHYNSVHKFIPMPQATKIPDAKAAVDKGWEKPEKLTAWGLEKVNSEREVILEAQREK